MGKQLALILPAKNDLLASKISKLQKKTVARELREANEAEREAMQEKKRQEQTAIQQLERKFAISFAVMAEKYLKISKDEISELTRKELLQVRDYLVPAVKYRSWCFRALTVAGLIGAAKVAIILPGPVTAFMGFWILAAVINYINNCVLWGGWDAASCLRTISARFNKIHGPKFIPDQKIRNIDRTIQRYHNSNHQDI